MKAAGALAAALGWLLGAGAVAAEAPWEIEAGVAHERLSTGAPDWRQTDLALRRRLGERSLAEAGLRRAQRYGGADTEASLGFSWPVAGGWTATLRGHAADAPRFLPRHGADAELGVDLGGGWVVQGGVGRKRFAAVDAAPATGTSALRLGAERYVGAWRLAAGWSRTRLDGGAAADGLRLQADHWFGDEARVGLLVASGDELENAPGGVVSTRVDALVLLARWPIAAGWSFVADLGRTRAGRSTRRTGDTTLPGGPGYDRTGGRIGVQHRF